MVTKKCKLPFPYQTLYLPVKFQHLLYLFVYTLLRTYRFFVYKNSTQTRRKFSKTSTIFIDHPHNIHPIYDTHT